MTPERFSTRALHIGKQAVFRYMGCLEAPSDDINALVEAAISEAEASASFRICYLKLPMKISQTQVVFGDFPPAESSRLASHFAGCAYAVLFCASCGTFFDRKIAASQLSPATAMVWDAVGTAAVEQLCDDFCEKMKTIRTRFSPGYGDLPFSFQSDLLRWLDAAHYPGVGLTDSLLMTPVKSVTAIAALESL